MSINTQRHELVFKDIQKQVSRYFNNKERARVYHGGSNSTRSRASRQSKLIDISKLNRVVEINKQEHYAVVEPNVNLGQLVDSTLHHELVPPVISEFPAITVGGAIQGGAGQSSSFKYGCFHDFCIEYEVILGDGSRAIVDPNKNSDLFYGLPCSFGTLGIITKIKLKLIPSSPYIKLQYHNVSSFEEAMELIKKHTLSPNGPDFVDGIMFSKNSGTIMVGYYSKLIKNLPEVSFSKFYDEWFYLHAQKVTKKNSVYEELIPIKDYLFRYDRGAFWAGRAGAKVARIPFNRLTRLLLAPMFKTSTMYRFLQGARISQKFLVQDNLIPKENVASFMKFVDKKYGIYPFWLCPLRTSKKYFLSPTFSDSDMVVDVGVWGAMVDDYDKFVQRNRVLEAEVQKKAGRKVLYAHGYYSKKEFWEIYDQARYEHLRTKYSAQTVFPDIYEKIYVSERYKTSILRGFWKMLVGS